MYQLCFNTSDFELNVAHVPSSPVLQRQRAAATATRVTGAPGGPGVLGKGQGGSPKKKKEEEQRKVKDQEEEERLEEEVQQLQTQCKEQNKQLVALRLELKKTVLGLDTLAICAQHFCLQVMMVQSVYEDTTVYKQYVHCKFI